MGELRTGKNNIDREFQLSVDLYKSIERDFEQLRLVVEIEESNYDTYGLRYYEMIVRICIAFESFCKILLRKKNITISEPNIIAYKIGLIFKDFCDTTAIGDIQKNIRHKPNDYLISNICSQYGVSQTSLQQVTLDTYFNIPPIKPFEEWREISSSASWWDGYNNIKHNIHDNLVVANLKNSIKSLAALYFTLLVVCKYRVSGGHLAPPNDPYIAMESCIFRFINTATANILKSDFDNF